jgi:hypothetical protein
MLRAVIQFSAEGFARSFRDAPSSSGELQLISELGE